MEDLCSSHDSFCHTFFSGLNCRCEIPKLPYFFYIVLIQRKAGCYKGVRVLCAVNIFCLCSVTSVPPFLRGHFHGKVLIYLIKALGTLAVVQLRLQYTIPYIVLMWHTFLVTRPLMLNHRYRTY